MAKNKIIISSGTLSFGGAERVLSILSHEFALHYEDVTYLTWIDVPDFYEIHPKVKRVCVERECNSHNIVIKALWFRKYIKKEKPSIVLSFLAPFNVLTCFALIGIKTKLVVAERNDPRHIWNGLIQRNLRTIAYHMADGILEQTENNKNYFSGSLLNKTDVIYNPITMPDDYVGSALITPKKKRIVSVARLTAQKNPEMLLRAFKQFYMKHTDYTLTLYGEGPYRHIVEQAITDMGLFDVVFVPGSVKDIWYNIRDAECFVLSSWFEGMPNALLEAMCLGLPCISTKVSGAVDLITNYKNGILVDLDDHVSMAEALCEVIDNKELQVQIGKNAFKLYDILNIKVISKQWLNYIDRIIGYNE